MVDAAHITAADIARIAQVSRTTVSNWRRRHGDFPDPVGGVGNRALFDRAQVEAWLADGGRLPERAPHEHVWDQVRTVAGEGGDLGDAVARVQGLLLALAEGGTHGVDLARERLSGLPGGDTLALAAQQEAANPARARRLSDRLHQAYLAALGGKAHITPEPLARLMADLAGVRGAEAFDPACGTGALLRAAADGGAVGLYGQEIADATAHLARARVGMVVSGAPGEIAWGDSLISDAFPGRRFDAVLCNPPFNQKEWGADRLAYDERWAYGVPPRAESELAWIQHCLSHSRPGGRVVVLMPPAAASRPSGRRIRRELVRRGALRAVIGLPAGAAAPVHVGLHLWVLEPPGEDTAPVTQVLFVSAAAGSGASGEGERRPVEWERLHRDIGEAWNDFLEQPEKTADVPGLCRSVPAVDLLDDSVDVTPERHLPLAVPEASADDARKRAAKLRRSLLRDLDGTRSAVPGQGWAAREGEEWRMATVADLARSGALVLHRAPSAASGLVPSGEEHGQGGGPRVLTVADLLRDRKASGRLDELVDPVDADRRVEVLAGDVIIPSALARSDLSRSRVATEADAGVLLGLNLHLLRPDPAHIDPWFLAGFLDDEDNLRQAGQGSLITRVDLRRLRVPLLSLHDQRRYGAAFRELHEFRTELDRARKAARELGDRLVSGLRSGLLVPPRPVLPEDGPDVP
ncbi:N-6 DNA methylase [Nocardiopsis lambiniae]|uniref:N-6 DNA methylase n=1 Tax=Nocardiopsis lambiniae TaxID=3075539 RepID=A0ABU2MBF3_9ACTN|nr:N-6 DNA methylase [Nocardiopsis sp. DSM 44743]MDT0330014.1 N-6 DNA methylase [Nocardiopsis sp. DSM 44743]